MQTLQTSLGEIGGVVRTLFGLTRHNRLKTQIRESVELYGLTIQYVDLEDASKNLRNVITTETGKLVETSSSASRSWNWPAAFVSWAIAGFASIPELAYWSDWQSWWKVLIMVLSTLVGLIFLIVGFGVLLEQKVGPSE